MSSGIDLRPLADLIRKHNINGKEITEIINKGAKIGDVGEFIAHQIFYIDLEKSGNNKGSDGKFTKPSPLDGKSVNIKWYVEQGASMKLDLPGNLPENLSEGKDLPCYYLVFKGAKSKDGSFKKKSWSWSIDNVFLFEASSLISLLRKRVSDRTKGAIKIGTQTSLLISDWKKAQIYPVPSKPPLKLTKDQENNLKLFSLVG